MAGTDECSIRLQRHLAQFLLEEFTESSVIAGHYARVEDRVSECFPNRNQIELRLVA